MAHSVYIKLQQKTSGKQVTEEIVWFIYY